MPALSKPSGCTGCALADKGTGFALPEGPTTAPLLFVGEALGKVEAHTGRPFVGDAGGMLSRQLALLGWDRRDLRIANAISCRPPNDWFDERAPWYREALHHCPYLDPVLAEPHQVIVTLGQTALKRVLGLVGHKKIRVQDWHGTATRLPSGQYVVPTYHPSFLQRGANNLLGTVLWDLQRAEGILREGWPPDPGTLVEDPPPDWFAAWVDQVVAARQQDPQAYPISVDVETPDKADGRDEGELSSEDRSMQIIRVNVACHPDEGITVPFAGIYVDLIARLLASPGPQWYWNREYDFERLVKAGVLREAQSPDCVDLMWLWHVLQSDLPRGLGFVAPFYSRWGAWKHLSGSDPVRYAAVDALQTHRIGFGVIEQLIQQDQYRYAMRHTHDLHTRVLRPAQLVGVKVNRDRLTVFNQELTDKATAAMARIQAAVPDSLQPLTPKAGLAKKPLADVLHVKASNVTRRGTARKGRPIGEIKLELYAKSRVVERLLLREVWVCRTCGAVDIQRRHRCPPLPDPAAVEGGDPGQVRRRRAQAAADARVPQLELAPATVTRWFWQEPFNPDSPGQILAFIKARGHKAGVAKKTHAETTNRETLERLARTTRDPFYAALLDYRAVMKVKSTYVEGTARRLDSHDRLHPKPTFKPSTMRLSYVDPNITNVVADKGSSADKPALAAGFRKCIVAADSRPADIDPQDPAFLAWCQKYGQDPSNPAVWRCQLVEVDFSAIEAVLTAYRAGDPEMMRLAKLGIHAALASHVLGRPYDPAWPDAQISSYFEAIKKEHPEVYDPAKRFIHGRNYGLTLTGMMLTFPHLFPTKAVARRFEQTFASMAPKIPAWQLASQRIAARQHYLGGADHPFHYKHWFWAVYTHRRITAAQYYTILAKCRQQKIEAPVLEVNGQYFRIGEGEDAKRALAFFGQSVGAGVLKEALLRCLADPTAPNYVGDAYFGQTPLRAPIHDSGLFEIPLVILERILRCIVQEFTRPVPELPLPAEWGLGSHLAIGVAVKAGDDWEHMRKVPIDGLLDAPQVTPPEDDLAAPVEDEDGEDWADLERVG